MEKREIVDRLFHGELVDLNKDAIIELHQVILRTDDKDYFINATLKSNKLHIKGSIPKVIRYIVESDVKEL